MPLGIHLENVVGRTERVQLGPAVEILECIVGSVVGAPAHDALEMTAIVEVLREELATGRHVLGEEPPLENGPTRRIHTGVDAEGYVHGVGPHAGHDEPATDDERGCAATECWMMHKPYSLARLFRQRDDMPPRLTVRRTCDRFCDTVRRFNAVPAAFLFEETP